MRSADRRLSVAAAQLDLKPFAARANMETVADVAQRAAEQGTTLLVLPEFINVGFELTDEIYAHAESMDGLTMPRFRSRIRGPRRRSPSRRGDTSSTRAGCIVS